MTIENDFGFSFEENESVSDSEILSLNNRITDLEVANEELYRKNREMYKKILTLLNNLKKNPKIETIKWPNRVEAIDKFIKELDELYEKARKGNNE